MIIDFVLNFSNTKGVSFNLKSSECYFTFTSNENLSYNQVQINLYNTPPYLFDFLKPKIMNGELFDNQNIIFITGIVEYLGGVKKTIFSQQLDNIYQQVHTPPNSVLTIKTYSILMSNWINKPLKTPLTIKNRSFKEVCAQVLGKYMGSFEVEDFIISGVFYNNFDLIDHFQLDGLRVKYNISYIDNKVNFVRTSTNKTLILTPESGLKTMPVLNVSDSSYVMEYFEEQTYYQVQFSTVLGLLNGGQQVRVTDFRGFKREGFVTQVSRSFNSKDGGSDSITMQEGLSA